MKYKASSHHIASQSVLGICARIGTKASIEFTSRQVIILILMIIIAAVVIILGIMYTEQGKTFIETLMGGAESFV